MPLVQLADVRPAPPVVEMSLDDVLEGGPTEQLVGKGQHASDGRMQGGVPEGEEIKAELKALAVVTLVVGKLDEGDDLCERLRGLLSLLRRATLRDPTQQLLEVRCTPAAPG